MIRAALALSLSLVGCASGFGIDLDVEPGCVASPALLEITVTLQPAGRTRTQQVTDPNAFFANGHHVAIVPTEGTVAVDVAVIARDAGGATVGGGSTRIPVTGHQLVEAALVLGGCSDGGSPLDLTAGCTTNAMCMAPTPFCDLVNGNCSECLKSTDCPMGEVCVNVNKHRMCTLMCTSSAQCRPPANACCAMACTDTTSDVANCGACGTLCTFAHAMPRCTAGVCGIQSCTPGYDDCDKVPQSGCETQTLGIDNANCGGCGVLCLTMNCLNGVCPTDDAGLPDLALPDAALLPDLFGN